MGQLQHPVLGTLEVPDRLLEPENRQELEQNLLQLAADILPQDEAWYETFTKQFGRTASETARGIGELTGITEKPENDYTVEFVRRARAIQNPKSALAGEIGGAIGDVPSYLFGGVARKGAGLLEQGLTRGASVGGVSGALTPVYDMFGDDRLDNAAIGAALGGILGGAGGVILKRLGYQTEEELADALRKASPEERARLEGEMEAAVMETTPKATTSEGVPTAKKPDAVAEAEAAQARATDPIRREADAQRFELETQDYTVRIQKAVDDLQAEVDQLPKRGQVKQFENAVKEHNSVIKAQENKLANLNKAVKAISNSKVAPKAQRAKIKMLETEKQRVQQKIDERVQLRDQRDAPLLNRINYLKDVRKELDSYYKEGSLPNAVIDVVGEPPKPPQAPVINEQYTTAPTVQTPAQQAPVSSDVPMGVEPPVMPTQQVVQAPAPVQTATAAPVQTPVQTPTPVQAATPARTPVQTPAPQQPAQPRQAAPAPTPVQNIRADQPTASTGYAPKPAQAQSITVDEPTLKETIGEAAAKTGKGLDYVFGNVLTSIRNISPSIAKRMSRYDFNKAKRITKNSQTVEGFSRLFRNMSPNLQSSMNTHLMSGEFEEAQKLMTPEMKKEFNKVRGVLINLNKEAKDAGIKVPNIQNYFPRKVKEGKLAALRKALGRKETDAIRTNLKWWADKNGFKDIADIPQEKQIDIIDQTIRGIFRGEDAGKVSFQKKRTVDKIDPKLEQFYEDSVDSLLGYIEKSSRAIETAKFFRRKDVSLNSDGEPFVDNKSIGSVIQEAIIKEDLKDSAKIEELQGLLRSRFAGEVNSPNKLFGGIRDLGYIDTIGDVISAFKQVQDLAQSARKFGLGNTIAAAFDTKNMNAVDLGIENAIAHELQNGRKTVKLLQAVFNKSGFNFIDRLGKETIANAAHYKHVGMLKTPKGEAKFRSMYKDQLGEDMDQTIKDIKDGRFTDNVQFLAYNNVQDLQPINTTNMPALYSDLKNGRVLYMLKSFTLKQFDVVRREVVQEAAKGNVETAAKNMFMISTYLMASGVPTTIAVDWVLGREIRTEDLPERALWSLLGVFGMNAYLWDRYLGRGDLTSGAANTLAPPMGTSTLPYRVAAEAFKEEPSWDKFLKDVPILGTILYNRLGTGAEKYNERLDD